MSARLSPGEQLLHYRLVEQIGAGGMGVVWRAVDTTLEREVAIKVLPEDFAADSERLVRFEREAKLVASLNHANVASLFSVHEAEGLRFLAMELVPGEDLSQRISGRPLETSEALEIAEQIASALEAAHDQGIVHRDLKPANVRITPDGAVKVLDFGLARVFESTAAAGDPELSPTLTSAGTLAGVIMGTAAYMSPEQARGEPVDARTDIWAFGSVLYEMLTGQRAHPGDTVTDTLAGVLKSEPEWAALPAELPRPVRRLLRRCLQKDRRKRLHHIADARLEIRDALDRPPEETAPGSTTGAPSAGRWTRILPWALTGLFAALALLAVATRPAPSPSDATSRHPLELSAPLPTGQALVDTQEAMLDVSPDGRRIAVVLSGEGSTRLFLRELDDSEPRPLEGTRDASTPFFSPDGRWIGFIANGVLRKISIDGGAPLTLCPTGSVSRGATWSSGDRIVFSPSYNSGLMQVSAAGGNPEPLTELDVEAGERTHRWPSAIQGTDVVLFTVGTVDSPEYYDEAAIEAVRTGSGERVRLFQGASWARYAASGHLILGRGDFLLAAPFDLETLQVTGPPVPVAENVASSVGSGLMHAAFSTTGLLVHAPGAPFDSERRLTWRWIDGRSEALALPVAPYRDPALSPDARLLAVAVVGERDFDVWVYELDGGRRTRLTFDEQNIGPIWLPDGDRVAFYSGQGAAWAAAADGSRQLELIHERPDRLASVSDWSPDGRLAFMNIIGTDSDLEILDVETGETRVLVATEADERDGHLSPDGRYLAYSSNQTGRDEVYVTSFPDGTGRWQVSTEGGLEPYWSADGRRIFYRNGRQVSYAEIDTSRGFRAGQPIAFADISYPFARENSAFTVHPDGERVLTMEPPGPVSEHNELRVIVDWFEGLRRLAP